MSSSVTTRVVLVSADPELETSVRRSLKHAHMDASLEVCSTLKQFEAALRQPTAEVFLVSEGGLPKKSTEQIIQALGRVQDRPVLIVGQTLHEGFKLHLMRKPAAETVPLNELHRVPLAIEHALRKYELQISEARLQSEIQRAADAVGQNQKLATIGRLAGSIAHEINNPLESITNLLYLIAHDAGLSEQSRAYLELAQVELERVAAISKQTLAFSRETSEPVPVHVPDLLEEVLTLYRRRIAEKQIAVERQYGDAKTLLVHPGELRQVISNLVSNALEAMETKGVLRLRVRSGACFRYGCLKGLRISVADTGLGMGAETLRRLGEPFFTTKGQRGTGLGLWVTRSIIRRYGGTLQMRSRTGNLHGTVFTVFLPSEPHLRIVERSDRGTATESNSPAAEVSDGRDAADAVLRHEIQGRRKA